MCDQRIRYSSCTPRPEQVEINACHLATANYGNATHIEYIHWRPKDLAISFRLLVEFLCNFLRKLTIWISRVNVLSIFHEFDKFCYLGVKVESLAVYEAMYLLLHTGNYVIYYFVVIIHLADPVDESLDPSYAVVSPRGPL